jgi:hypothetical protein
MLYLQLPHVRWIFGLLEKLGKERIDWGGGGKLLSFNVCSVRRRCDKVAIGLLGNINHEISVHLFLRDLLNCTVSG